MKAQFRKDALAQALQKVRGAVDEQTPLPILTNVLLEARAAGLPIVANRVGGVGEALDKDLNEFSLERMVQKTFALYRS